MLIAQITDSHLRSDGVLLHDCIDTVTALANAVDHVNRLDPPPDVVLATGDLADTGLEQDYALLRRQLDRLAMPYFVIPGNHDERPAMHRAFADKGYFPATDTFLHYVVESFPLRLIGLDTVIPGEIGGGLCPARLGWLAERLAEAPERPTLIFMHHPPFATGIRFMDQPPFEGAEALKDILLRHAQVREVICGHIHRAIHAAWAGTIVAVAPSTAYQMPLAFRADQRFHLTGQPPAIALYLWQDESDMRGFHSVVGGPSARRHPAGGRP
jgi:3',5'-cyclic AMP phosphodiesterase CpdA